MTIQKLQKWSYFWIHKLLKSCSFWIQKLQKWTSLLSGTIHSHLRYTDSLLCKSTPQMHMYIPVKCPIPYPLPPFLVSVNCLYQLLYIIAVLLPFGYVYGRKECCSLSSSSPSLPSSILYLVY